MDEIKSQYREYLRTREVSEMTGIPEGSLRWWRHKNVGPKSGRLGGRIVYRRADVEAWIESQLNATAAGGTD